MQFYDSKGLSESLLINSFKSHFTSILKLSFHQDIIFRFHILLFPSSRQLAEKQGDSSKNETKLQTTGDIFLVSGCAQLQIRCLQACLLPSLRQTKHHSSFALKMQMTRHCMRLSNSSLSCSLQQQIIYICQQKGNIFQKFCADNPCAVFIYTISFSRQVHQSSFPVSGLLETQVLQINACNLIISRCLPKTSNSLLNNILAHLTLNVLHIRIERRDTKLLLYCFLSGKSIIKHKRRKAGDA